MHKCIRVTCKVHMVKLKMLILKFTLSLLFDSFLRLTHTHTFVG